MDIGEGYASHFLQEIPAGFKRRLGRRNSHCPEINSPLAWMGDYFVKSAFLGHCGSKRISHGFSLVRSPDYAITLLKPISFLLWQVTFNLSEHILKFWKSTRPSGTKGDKTNFLKPSEGLHLL